MQTILTVDYSPTLGQLLSAILQYGIEVYVAGETRSLDHAAFLTKGENADWVLFQQELREVQKDLQERIGRLDMLRAIGFAEEAVYVLRSQQRATSVVAPDKDTWNLLSLSEFADLLVQVCGTGDKVPRISEIKGEEPGGG